MTRRTLFASIAALFGVRQAKITKTPEPRAYSYSIQCITRSGASLSPLQYYRGGELRLPRVLHPGGAYNPKNWTTDARIPVNRVEVLNQKLWNDHMDQQARSIGVSMDALTRSVLPGAGGALVNQRHMLQPRPHIRIYRADDGTSIPNPLFLRDMLRGGLSVTLEPPAGREPWGQATKEPQ